MGAFVMNVIFKALLVFMLAFLAPQIASADTMTRLNNSDRPGYDYRNFWQSRNDPEVCRKACLDDVKCKAWTYVNPGVQGKQSRCFLKDRKALDVRNTCCVSGVRIVAANTAPPEVDAFTKNIQLPGATYKTLTLLRADPKSCQKACIADKKCKSWTYRARGDRLVGYKPQCYLKNSVPIPVRANGRTSGVKNVVAAPNLKVGTSVLQKPVLINRPATTVRPTKPPPQAGIRTAPTGSSRVVANPGGRAIVVAPKLGVNPAVENMFDQMQAKRNAAIREAAARAKARRDALDEMRRRASANDPTSYGALDCDDSDPAVHPNQNEVCNFKDDDCNGLVDEGVTLTVYRDADGDSFGDPEHQTHVCASGSGLVGMSLNALDCDDNDVRKNPAAGTCN